MACLKCRSEWVTLKGKDMVSCPECCKQQRCKARKQGRLPAEQEKTCERCGCKFTAIGANAVAKSRHCATCSPLARREYNQARNDKIKAGGWKARPQRDRKGRKCFRCGSPLNHNQNKYCGSGCYNAAKKEGAQAWDRTAQLESVWHRGGRWACAPSRKPVQEMRTNMQAFLRKVQRLYAAALRELPTCLNCGKECKHQDRDFCSPDCGNSYRELLPCKRCGSQTKSKRKRPGLCVACACEAERAYRKMVKLETGTYRKRCRKYGGYYNRRVTRRKVFERDGWRCHVCKKKTIKHWANNDPREATVDHHPVPLSHGGDHDWNNVRCACRKCNSEKSNKWDGQKRLLLTG
jgi:hypothetical protein